MKRQPGPLAPIHHYPAQPDSRDDESCIVRERPNFSFLERIRP